MKTKHGKKNNDSVEPGKKNTLAKLLSGSSQIDHNNVTSIIGQQMPNVMKCRISSVFLSWQMSKVICQISELNVNPIRRN